MVFGLLVGGGSLLGGGVDRDLPLSLRACPGLESLFPEAQDSVLLHGNLAPEGREYGTLCN